MEHLDRAAQSGASSLDRSMDKQEVSGKHTHTATQDISDQESGKDEQETRPSMPSKSAGVARIEALSAHLSFWDRAFLLFGVFMIGYAYGLDGQIRYTFQSYATSSFEQHSLLATINVLRSVISAATQPTAARIADVFGRFELVLLSTVFYVVGTAVEASATNLSTFAGGVIIYQVGYTAIILLVEIIIADITSMKSRVLFSYIPAAPFLINVWISGNVTQAVLGATTWRWGIGMWAIIFTVCSLPLLVILFIVGRRADKKGEMAERDVTWSSLRHMRSFLVDMYHRLDLIGLVLLIAVLALILTPLTIAGGASEKWGAAHIIAMLVIGFCCIPAFVLWELYGARFPVIPFYLLKDRGVWSALVIRCLLNVAWSIQADYLYTVLIVAFDFSVATATRVLGFYSFFGLVSGPIMGLIVYKVRRLKYFIVFGTCLFMVAYGLLIRYRGDDASKAGMIGAQVLLGLAGGLFAYPTMTSVQAATSHEHVAIVTGIYLSSFNIGSAVGNCISGAIWTQTLYGKLERGLQFQSNSTLALAAYNSPFEVIVSYPWGTPVREAMVDSYQSVQKLLCITGICICAPMILFSFFLRNPRLSDEQSQPEANERAARVEMERNQRRGIQV